MDLKLIESVLCIYLYKNTQILRLNLGEDINIFDIIKDEISYINDIFKDYFEIFQNGKKLGIKILSFSKIKELDNNILHLMDLVSGDIPDNVYIYTKSNFSGKYLDYLLPFFEFSFAHKIKDRNLIQDYLNNFSNFNLKTLLLFLYYGIGNDNLENTTKSIQLLTEIIDKYPSVSSLYLLRMRQRFNLIYKIIYGVNKFNKLIITQKGKEFILNDKNIKECFLDLEKAENLYKDNPIFYLFKGKFLLHLLDENGLHFLFLYLKSKNYLFDVNVFSWFGVYYLQIGNFKEAKYYLESVNYASGDRYKAYSKLIFLYVKGNYKCEFLDFVLNKFSDLRVLIYDNGKYYDYFEGKLVLKEIDDNYNHKDKMGFKLENFEGFFNKNYLNENDYLEDIFENISKNYYDHFSSELRKKVVFYSKSSFNSLN